jgi:hypothetical protein
LHVKEGVAPSKLVLPATSWGTRYAQQTLPSHVKVIVNRLQGLFPRQIPMVHQFLIQMYVAVRIKIHLDVAPKMLVLDKNSIRDNVIFFFDNPTTWGIVAHVCLVILL